jgi:hypothetical protein
MLRGAFPWHNGTFVGASRWSDAASKGGAHRSDAASRRLADWGGVDSVIGNLAVSGS